MKASILCFILLNCVVLSRCSSECFSLNFADAPCSESSGSNVIIQTDSSGRDCSAVGSIVGLINQIQADSNQGKQNKYEKLYEEEKERHARLTKELADTNAQLTTCTTEVNKIKKEHPPPTATITRGQYSREQYWKCGVGIQDRNRVTDSQLTSTVTQSPNSDANNGRLFETRDGQAWIVAGVGVGTWIKVDLLKDTRIIGVATRGRPTGDNQWVTTYKMEYQANGGKKQTIVDANGSIQVFGANWDPLTAVANIFRSPITARYWTLLPLTWNKWISMQFELLIC